MLFSSLEFLCGFLPLTIALYFLCPTRWRNALLLAVSLLFYASGEPIYLFLMIVTVAADYVFGRWIERSVRSSGNGRFPLMAAIIFNLSLLGFFKYYDFFASWLGFPTLGLALPIGISFYTFQAMSYVIDVYRREVEAQRSLVDFGTYVTLFPQLIAGPIVRYSDVDGQLQRREHTLSRAASGIATFCAGLAKKVLLANAAGEICETLRVGAPLTVVGAWLWLLSYAFQIYFDFSGYSDMAVGLGRMFGFDFPENFCYPYVARSITDFWRRWHITLSSWFREYVYIPLGGNRMGKWRTYRNLLITWALTGLWHGAAWNFLLWGLYFFLLLSLEKAFLKRWLERLPRIFQHGYAIFCILFGWLIFASDGGVDGVVWFRALFGMEASAFFDDWTRYELVRNLPLLLLMAVGAMPLPKRVYQRLCARKCSFASGITAALCVGALLLSIAYLADSGYNPFLYFRF